MTSYAVTGASGHLGRLIVQDLLDRGIAPSTIVAIVRTPSKVADFAERGVQVRQADYADPASLLGALEGVDRLVLVSSPEVGQRLAQHTAVVEAAQARGVQRIAYTSILRADTTTNPLAPEHLATEQLIAGAGLPHSFLRNGWYTENYTAQLGGYLAGGAVVGAAGDGVISAATRADYAAAAATAIIDDTADEAIHELGGEGFTLADLAATVSRASGRDVAYRNVSEQELAGFLEQHAHMPAPVAGLFAAIDTSIAGGALEVSPDALRALAGRPLTTLQRAIEVALA